MLRVAGSLQTGKVRAYDLLRMIGVQLNIGEGRDAPARRIFFGRLGELRHGYRDGMENQVGALGMALNAVVFWDTLYIEAAVKELEAGGLSISPEIRARGAGSAFPASS